MIKITEAKFITSSPSIKEALPESISEIAILGRSNVGKSSFINALTNRKNLAKSSSTPGKTRLINFFDIVFTNEDEKFLARLVDFPGFGYARVSKTQKKEWEKSLTEYIVNRKSIKVFVHLLDARHPDLELDKNVREFLKKIKSPDQTILEIFTKADKIKQKEKAKIFKMYENPILVSNLKKTGIQKATEAIFKALFENNKEEK